MPEEKARNVMIKAIQDALEAASMAQLGVLLKLIRGYLGI